MEATASLSLLERHIREGAKPRTALNPPDEERGLRRWPLVLCSLTARPRVLTFEPVSPGGQWRVRSFQLPPSLGKLLKEDGTSVELADLSPPVALPVNGDFAGLLFLRNGKSVGAWPGSNGTPMGTVPGARVVDQALAFVRTYSSVDKGNGGISTSWRVFAGGSVAPERGPEPPGKVEGIDF